MGLISDFALLTLEEYLMNKLPFVWIGTDGSQSTSSESELYLSVMNRFASTRFHLRQVLGTDELTAFKINTPDCRPRTFP